MGRVRVETDGKRIQLTGWVGSNTPALCKSVGAGRWSPAHKVWTFPLEMGTCRRLREVFGDKLSIGPELNAWAREAKIVEAAMLELAKAEDAQPIKLKTLAPRIDAALHPYQRVAAVFGAANDCTFGLFDQPGLGKTLETMAALVEGSDERAGLHYPTMHLVFCPKIAVDNVWEPEIRRWLGNFAEVHPITGTRSQREKALAAALASADVPAGRGLERAHVFVLVNIEMARIKGVETDEGVTKFLTKNALWPELFSRIWDTVVVDESDRALIRTSGKPTQTRAGMTKLRSRRRIAISGTPMRGKPSQLWGTLNWLRPDIYTSYWTWVGKYWNLVSNGFSNYILGEMQVNAEQRMYDDMATIALRRTKDEVFPQLPRKRYAGTLLDPDDETSPYQIWLKPSEKHLAQYQEFSQNASLDFDDGGFIFANESVSQYTRLKQLALGVMTLVNGKLTPTTDSVKFEWLVQKLAELGINGKADNDEGNGKIVVASEFTSVINVFAAGLRELGIDSYVITGETPNKARTEIIERFQSEDLTVRVLLLNKKAGGVALTLDRADDLVLLERSRNPDDDEQVEDRIHRASRIHNVLISVLGTIGTQEEEVAWIAAAGEDTLHYVLDGARGIEYAKQRYRMSREALSH